MPCVHSCIDRLRSPSTSQHVRNATPVAKVKYRRQASDGKVLGDSMKESKSITALTCGRCPCLILSTALLNSKDHQYK